MTIAEKNILLKQIIFNSSSYSTGLLKNSMLFDNKLVLGIKNYTQFFPYYLVKDFEDLKIVTYNLFENNYTSNICIYPFFKYEDNYADKIRYADFFYYLKGIWNGKKYFYTNEEVKILVTKGYIINNNNQILLCLGLKNTNSSDVEVFTKEGMKLYISEELIINPVYKNLYNKLKTEYLKYFYQLQIPIEITHSRNIFKQFFNDNIDFNSNFESITDLENYLQNNNIRDLISFNAEEYYKEIAGKISSDIEEEIIEEDNSIIFDDVPSTESNQLESNLESSLDTNEDGTTTLSEEANEIFEDLA